MRCFVGSHRLVYILRHASRLSKTPHFWGLRHAHPGEGYDPKIGTLSRFLCNAPTPKFHHPMFTRSEVIVLTNKHTNPQANRRRRKHPAFFATPRRWVISVMEKLLLLFSFADFAMMNVLVWLSMALLLCARPRVKRVAGSAVDLAATVTSSHQPGTSSSSSSSSLSTASVTDGRFTSNLTTFWTNADQLRQSLPFSK